MNGSVTSRPAMLLVFVCVFFSACNRAKSPQNTAKSSSAGHNGPSSTHTPARSNVAPPVISSRYIRDRQTIHERVLDPAQDGWKSEVLSSNTQRIIDELCRLASDKKSTEEKLEKIARLLSDDFFCSPIRPREIQTVFRGHRFQVNRPGGSQSSATDVLRGAKGVVKIFSDLVLLMGAFNAPDFHTKAIRMQETENGATSVHLIESKAVNENGVVECHWTWNCNWRISEHSRTPQLVSLEAFDFEETIAKKRLFSDQTRRAFGESKVYREQLSRGLNHWLDRIEITHGMYIFAEYGVAVGDVNGDGHEDIYVCQPGGLPNRLLLATGDGQVVDDSVAAGVDWLDHTSSALLLDFDNDNDQDLAIAVESRKIIFMRNDGSGKFSVAFEFPLADRHVQGLSAADFDNDGRLDVYLTVGFADSNARKHERRPPFVYHDANEGGANVLLQNRISPTHWDFVDVTAAVGLEANNRRHSLAAAWEDFDNDGDQDLYVANDYGQNCLYENSDGKFRNVAIDAGLTDFGSGMSVSWADYDHDGWMDLYVGNMFSSAGNRITRQAAFQNHIDPNSTEILKRFAKGNSLFRNLGNGRFREVGDTAAVEFGRWAWSSLFCDINNDGWEDLIVANGYVTSEDERDL